MSPLGESSRRSFVIIDNKIEIPTPVFIAMLHAVGGSISFDGVELSRDPRDYEIITSEMRDPYRLILEVKDKT